MLPWARALILHACGPECEFPAALGKVRHGQLSYNPSPGQQRQADHEDSLPGQPPHLKVVMYRVVEEKSASAVAFIAASQ